LSALFPNVSPCAHWCYESYNRATNSSYRVLPVFICLLVFAGVFCSQGWASTDDLSGIIVDAQHRPIAGAQLEALMNGKPPARKATTGSDGRFRLACGNGTYLFQVDADGYQPVRRRIVLHEGRGARVEIQLHLLLSQHQSVTVSATEENTLTAPDPAQLLFIRQETLDANPGRPGAPVSIPGLPIETASGGIKAPQYFAPGVAGDHGEPIAQYVQLGDYLLPNNLSANAHGNGYADPNILIPAAIESVQTDGGAFNVREGNHATNLAIAYGLRSRLQPALTLTGDRHDIDLVAGWSPAGDDVPAWMAVEVAAGNGFLHRAEHRRQFKANGFRVWKPGRQEISLLGIGYEGSSFIPGLVPIAATGLNDTIDPRQKDQTHTGELGLNDRWQASPAQQVQLSGFFRTYNLALDSNFGDGLIRQSEFRTVNGSDATWLAKVIDGLAVMAGVDAQRDAPRRLDLDRYASTDPAMYGPFQKVMANDVTIDDLAPFFAFNGGITSHLRYYFGLRQDEIRFDNTDLLTPRNSFGRWAGVTSPKTTISFYPGSHSVVPTLSWSAGEAFYTNDPRIGTGTTQGTLVSRIHSYQLVASKDIARTEFRLTLGHVTSEGSLAKLDPDTGLQLDEGPGRLRLLTIAATRSFGAGMLQSSISKADARVLNTGLPTPEAPRTIVDILGTLDRLPFHLEARGEFERVGAKPLGDGFIAAPVTEMRVALLRTFLEGRIEAGVNMLIASGYTGQTTEVLALAGEAAPFERVVGVRLPSYLSLSATWHLGPRRSGHQGRP